MNPLISLEFAEMCLHDRRVDAARARIAAKARRGRRHRSPIDRIRRIASLAGFALPVIHETK